MGLFDFLRKKKEGPNAPEVPKEGGVENLAAEAGAFADKAEAFADKAEAFAEERLKGVRELSDAVKNLHRKKAHRIYVGKEGRTGVEAGQYLENLGMLADALQYFKKDDVDRSDPEGVNHQLRVAAAMGDEGLVAKLHKQKAHRIYVGKEGRTGVEAGQYLEELGMLADALEYFKRADVTKAPDGVDHQLRVAAAMGNDELVAKLHKQKAHRIYIGDSDNSIVESGQYLEEHGFLPEAMKCYKTAKATDEMIALQMKMEGE